MDFSGVLAPDGLSKTFDASANGYARAEGNFEFFFIKIGAGLVLLTTLSTAIAMNLESRIRCLILSSSSNHVCYLLNHHILVRKNS